MPLVTRQYGPNAKNSKLSFFDMDSNLYYLQNVGVSALTFSNSTLTLTNPTGGSISTLVNTVTGFTYSNNELTISDTFNNTYPVTINEVTGLTVNGTISATTYQNLPPASFTGGTVNGFTEFTNGLNVDIISATTYQNLPQDIFVTGGTYTNGEILFKNNAGSNFTVTGLPIGGAGGQIYYLNLSQTQSPYNEFSPIGSNLPEQVSAVTINSGVTSTIASFLTPVGYPNTTTIPAGYWSFYLHSYKDVVNASFDIFCEVYTYTTGGTETLILTTEGADVTTYSPTVSMELTDGYYSGGTIDITDRILVKVRTTNNGSQTNTLSFFTEGQQHYSYGITPFSNFNALTCETLSGCTTIVNLENNKVNKSGDTMTGTLIVPTISATTITVNGSIIATGITQSIFSGNSSSDLVRITQTGSGRAFVVEDSANPDFTPFQINNFGQVGVGTNLVVSSYKSASTVNAQLEVDSTLGGGVTYGIYQGGSVISLPSYGVFGNATGIGVWGTAASDSGGIGVYGQTGNAGGESQSGDYIGGKFESFTSGGNRYSLQLLDGTEGVGKVLVSQTSDGKSNWSSSLTGLTTVDTTLLKISGITVNPKQTIALFFGHDSLSPGDTQTYYIGNAINLTAPISGSDGRRVIIPKTGNIVRVDICQNVGGVVATGSTEYSTFTINNVTQSTQSTITTTYLYNTSNGNIAYDLGTPLSVNVGDKIEIRWTTPAWVINPTAVRQQMNVYLEY